MTVKRPSLDSLKQLPDSIKQLPDRVRRLFDRTLGPGAKPLDVKAALLDDLEGRVVPIGGGTRILPFNRVTVRLLADGPNARAPLEAAFRDYGTRVRERLRELRCEEPRDLQIRYEYLKKPRREWAEGQTFDVEYDQTASSHAASATAEQPVLHLKVTAGSAARDKFAFKESVVRIGRAAELRDQLGNVRRNDVAFLDDQVPANQTVGRAHGHFKYDAARAEYRLFDEGSRNGTVIVRGVETIRVPPRDPVGVRVVSGDEIKFGDAVLKVEIRT